MNSAETLREAIINLNETSKDVNIEELKLLLSDEMKMQFAECAAWLQELGRTPQIEEIAS